MTKIDTKTLRELHAKATPGEWVYADRAPISYGSAWVNSPDVENIALCDGTRRSDTHGFCLRMRDGENEANTAFIVAAHNALPALLDRIEELEAENERLIERESCFAEKCSKTVTEWREWVDEQEPQS